MSQTIGTKSTFEDYEFTRFIKKIVLFSSGGPFLDGYIMVIIGIALIQIGPQLHLNTFWTGLIGASALAGLFLGGLVFGYVTDLIGRKLMFTVDLIAIVIFSIMQMFVTNAIELVFLRFLMGIAVGADFPIATALVAEFSPRKQRALIFGFISSMWYVGATAADIVGYFLVNRPGGWRWMLGSAAIPAILLVIGRLDTPESPAWLVGKGRIEEARAVTKKVFGPNAEPDIELANTKTRFGKVFEGGYGKRILFVSIFWTAAIVPLYALYTFGPAILNELGMGAGRNAILGDVVISAFFAIGCIPAMFGLTLWGRRPVLIWNFGIMGIALLVLGFVPNAPVAVIIGCFVIYAFFSGGPAILQWLYPNELFPTDIRATAVGLGTAFSRIGAFLGTFGLPYCLKSIGIGPTMLIGAVVTFVGMIATMAWAPETKGLTLAESGSITQSK